LEPERRKLDIRYAQLSPDRPCSLSEASGGCNVILKKKGEFAFAQGEPAVFWRGVESFEQAASPLHPAARDSRLAAKGQRVPAEPDGHPGGCCSVAALAVEAVRMFARVDCELRVVEPPGSHRESLYRLRTVVLFASGLEVGQGLL